MGRGIFMPLINLRRFAVIQNAVAKGIKTLPAHQRATYPPM
jgi:hypothetical protein